MKFFKVLLCCLLFSTVSVKTIAQDSLQVFSNDTITLAQAYINLSLTKTYFDSINNSRISKILPFVESELTSIKNKEFISQNATLYNFTNALFYFSKAKFLFKNDTVIKIDRAKLGVWKSTLEKAVQHFNQAKIAYNYGIETNTNSFFEMINFNFISCNSLQIYIEDLKREFTPFFNDDIYSDFKRIFNDSKTKGKYDFNSLVSFAQLYNISLKMHILNNEPIELLKEDFFDVLVIDENYSLNTKLDLISRFLQLKYLANEDDANLNKNLNLYNLYESHDNFMIALMNNNFFKEDPFFAKEINTKTCKKLYDKLQKKFPYTFIKIARPPDSAMDGVIDYSEDIKYFFPSTPPRPSSLLSLPNYKPALKTLGQVNNYFSTILNNAGFNKQLHYYYTVNDGFAITTSLERFNKDGKPMEDGKRFLKNFTDDSIFSFYEIYKSIFFEIESDIRLFAFIVDSKSVTVSNETMFASAAQDLLKKSYSSFPEDLIGAKLANKNLTILTYHFHQNKIAGLPQLILNDEITVREHLKNAGIRSIIE